MPERIALLGSTGSIGSQTLDIVERYPDKFVVDLLIAGNNAELLAKQAKQFRPSTVVIGNEEFYQKLRDELSGYGIEVYAGAGG